MKKLLFLLGILLCSASSFGQNTKPKTDTTKETSCGDSGGVLVDVKDGCPILTVTPPTVTVRFFDSDELNHEIGYELASYLNQFVEATPIVKFTEDGRFIYEMDIQGDCRAFGCCLIQNYYPEAYWVDEFGQPIY